MWKGAALLLSLFVPDIFGRGRMTDPVGRQSLWRVDKLAPINYDDDEVNCGGFHEHWNVNQGRCGLCGDSYSMKQPRPHEFGGIFGGFSIPRDYFSGQILPVTVKTTPLQNGYSFFDLCNLDEMPESEECFARNHMRVLMVFPFLEGEPVTRILDIPSSLKCTHCVLRWTFLSGYNWGRCPNNTLAFNCGPQIMLRNCADISIM